MTLQELLEHAHLDALGHLDEREQAAFEAAFAVAPPQVKAQIRTEQARWAPMDHLLPDVEPSPELRERVLDAVTAAMVSQGAGELSMRSGRRVSSAWRAASIGLMTAVIVLGTAFVYVYQTARENISTVQSGLATEDGLKGFKGNLLSALMSPQTERHFFTSDDPNYQDRGAVYTNATWSKSRVFLNLPQTKGNEEYRLVVIEPGDKIGTQLDNFSSNSVLEAREIKSLPANTKLAVVRVALGEQTTLDKVLMTVTL